MDAPQQRALLAIALMAAFADDTKAEAERAEIKRIAASLGADSDGPDLGTLVQDVLLRRVTMEQAAATLIEPAHRQLAYEMAVCVCDADGAQSPAEARFLAALKPALKIEASTAAFEAQADGLALAVDRPVADAAPAPSPSAGAAAGAGVDGAALDRSILNHAILCGALELLPQNWASMAIIPLQVKMVYGIGQAHGVQLDAGSAKEFIATVGVGLTSQYLEQFGRKLLGGLLGSVAGGLGRGVGRVTAGAAMSFATTYALGELAKRYYAGGRQMSTALLQQTYQGLLEQARGLQQQYGPQIQERARTLDAGRVLDLVRKPLA